MNKENFKINIKIIGNLVLFDKQHFLTNSCIKYLNVHVKLNSNLFSVVNRFSKLYFHRLELKCRRCLINDGNVVLRKKDVYCK